jgi:hypothetical protein
MYVKKKRAAAKEGKRERLFHEMRKMISYAADLKSIQIHMKVNILKKTVTKPLKYMIGKMKKRTTAG